jgi:2-alkyl-3-oxoalkanoate reductase
MNSVNVNRIWEAREETVRTLVTGGTGFLGGHLVRRLVQQGDQVRVLARPASRADRLPGEVEIVRGDLKDEESVARAVDGVDIIYHVGAATAGSWEEYRQGTIEATERIMRLALQSRVRRFLHVSSLAVYHTFSLKDGDSVDESSALEPNPEKVGPYCYSKVEAEKIALRYLEKGLRLTIVRPGLIYGPGGRLMFPHVGYFLHDRLFVMIGSGDNILPFTYVENTVDGFLLAAAADEAEGGSYHFVDSSEITQKEYLTRYREATGSRFWVASVPFPLLLRGTLLGGPLSRLRGGRQPFRPSRYSLISKWKSLRFETLRARTELGWTPRVSLLEGLNRTFQWYHGVSGQGSPADSADLTRRRTV